MGQEVNEDHVMPRLSDPMMDKKLMISVPICYGFLTYWLTHSWQSTQFANEFFGYRYRDLSILFLSIAPWVTAYFPLRNSLPRPSLFSRALLGTASCLLLLNIAYHAYYAGHAFATTFELRLIDRLDFWLRLSASFAKTVVLLACIIYPIFAVTKIIKGRRSGGTTIMASGSLEDQPGDVSEANLHRARPITRSRAAGVGRLND